MRWENGLILAVALANIAYNATLPLHYDEAYYWVWTQRLDFSYFDHPPMIAWLLWIVGRLGQTEAILRLVPAAIPLTTRITQIAPPIATPSRIEGRMEASP